MTMVQVPSRSRVVRDPFAPGPALEQMLRPDRAPFRFHARSHSAALAWQATTRRALARLLGSQQKRGAPFAPRAIGSVDKGDYVRHKFVIQISRSQAMPVYLLVPKGGVKPPPLALAFHGHGYGVKDIVGLWEDGSERDTPDGDYRDFGIALCRRGFAVAAPEIAGFGERQTNFSTLDPAIGQSIPTTCAHSAALAIHLGLSVIGMRVAEARRLVDYLSTRTDLDCSRLTAMGISGGGANLFFAACLDERIRACVISGYFSTFQDSVLAMQHCPCNLVPGLHRFGEMYDLVGLIAPRPLLIEAGTHDPIFPFPAVVSSVNRARQVYGTFGAKSRIDTDFFEGRHRINGPKAFDFLWETAQGSAEACGRHGHK
ncbi:MAG: Acetyl xylan esterase [Verrucomicrobia bacterium]|nr:Acetyl xylan esterase [Verrucomicrobiota bacterium]